MLQAVKKALEEQGAHVELIAKALGSIEGADGHQVPVDKSALTVGSIMYDAVFVPGGQESVAQLLKQGDARHFVSEAYKHGKAIGAVGPGVELLRQANIPGLAEAEARSNGNLLNLHGVVTVSNTSDINPFIQQFVAAITQHRHWTRPQLEQVPA